MWVYMNWETRSGRRGDGNDTPRLTSKGQLNSFVIYSNSFLKEARGASFNQVTKKKEVSLLPTIYDGRTVAVKLHRLY